MGRERPIRRLFVVVAPVPEAPAVTDPLPRWLVVLAWLVPAGVLAQAALAGQAWFVSPSLFGLHGGLGHGVLLLAALTATFAWLARAPRVVAVLATLAVVGLIGQTGLGYTGHRGAVALASSLHIPLGVALLGLTSVVAVLLSVHRPAEA
jgi:hypothetical protein